MTFPNRSSLSRPEEFSKVLQLAVVSTDASFKVLARNTGQSCSRLGMAVSRKVDHSAVKRNRLKRIIRESFRLHYLSHKSPQAVDIVVLPRPQALSICNRRLFEQLSEHWRRIDERLSKES
jgi:ribonuclease P protein component